jgi:hypothetical protein
MEQDEDWAPDPIDDAGSGRWKWGWNRQTGEATIWEVGGPGDGFPSHDTYLTAAWGRRPHMAGGDVVGVAESDPPTLVIHAYYGADVPDALIAAFRSLAPTAAIVTR